MKMVTKFVGILPLTRYFKFDKREGSKYRLAARASEWGHA
jgi:hypothetical protein